MNYTETLEYLYQRLPVFHQIGAAAYKPGLDNSIKMMQRLGNPQNEYKTIHVAGTNGKGSVSHFLSAILQAAGYKVGLYTSPHLVDFGERIRVNGEKIRQQSVIDFVASHANLFDEIQPSFFEATMAMAFTYFAAEKVDVAVVEVGLGGRLDSTNIIQPELSVITNIGFDHMQFLGDTLEKIAAEKAGIIKQNTPVVVGEYLPETRKVFEEKAEKERAPIIFAEDTQSVHFLHYENDSMKVLSGGNTELEIGLCGEYQLKNVATVLSVVEKLQQIGFQISNQALKKGLKDVVLLTGLQGRWQTVKTSPRVVMDTGHNKAGFEYVAHQLKQQKYRKMHIVIGMVDDKDYSGVLSLLPKEAAYYFTAAQTKRAVPPDELSREGEKYELKGTIYDTVEEAVRAALADAEEDDFVFIGGSNYVVGEALPLFG